MARPPRKDDEDSPAVREFYRAIGLRIRELRQTRNMTQKELSALSGVGATYIVEIEAVGVNLSVKLLLQFANALGVIPQDLLPSGEQTETPNVILPVIGKRIANLRDELTRLVREERDEFAKQLEARCNDLIDFVDRPPAPRGTGGP